MLISKDMLEELLPLLGVTNFDNLIVALIIMGINVLLLFFLIHEIKECIKDFHEVYPNKTLEDVVVETLTTIIIKLKNWFDKLF